MKETRDNKGRFVKGIYAGYGFKKGNRSWNTGLTKETSSKLKQIGKNISKANKGRKSWNTGLTKENNIILKKVADSKRGDKHYNWKSNKVGKSALHEWIRSNKPKKEFCEICKIKKSYDVANISGKYKRDIKDYKWLCRSCHMKDDGRLNLLQKNHRKWRAKLKGGYN